MELRPTWRDRATILFAFAAVFLCGYGIGHLVGAHRPASPPPPATNDAAGWERQTMQKLKESYGLRPEQVALVEKELALTAQAIAVSHEAVVLDYHHHLNRFYERLIDILDDDQANRLRDEKKALERRIELLEN